MLAAVCVVATGKNKSCIGIFGKNLFENSRKIRIIGIYQVSLLLVGNADKLKLCEILRLCCEAEFITSVLIITAGVKILCIGFKPCKLRPKHIADVNIALENIGVGVGALNLVRAVLMIKNIAVFYVNACSPGYIHCCFRIVCDTDENMIGLGLRAS